MADWTSQTKHTTQCSNYQCKVFQYISKESSTDLMIGWTIDQWKPNSEVKSSKCYLIRIERFAHWK